MDCPKCGEPVEINIEFCGNCGQPLVTTTSPGVQPQTELSAPALANLQPPGVSQAAISPAVSTVAPAPPPTPAKPIPRTGHAKAIVGLCLASLALPAAFVPILGIVLGVAGLILGTISRQYYKKIISLLAIIFGVVAIVLSLASWVYLAGHYKNQSNDQKNSSAVTIQN